MSITESPNGSTSVKNLTINGTNAKHIAPAGLFHIYNYDNRDSGKPVVIQGITWDNANNAMFTSVNANKGVISGNTINGLVLGPQCIPAVGVAHHKIANSVSPVWASTNVWGSGDTTGEGFLYIEGNTILNAGVDADDNARVVFRYNNITNNSVFTHGADTSTYGGRIMDIYNNVWNYIGSGPGSGIDLDGGCMGTANVEDFILLRGGTALVHHNTIPDLGSYETGKVSIYFLVQQVRQNSGSFACWNSLNYGGAGWPVPHQPGWGWITGSVNPGSKIGMPTGYTQDQEPIYFWGNTGGGNYDSPGVHDYPPNDCGAGADTASNYVQHLREFYVNADSQTTTFAAKYTPYACPHPLAQLSGTCNNAVNGTSGYNIGERLKTEESNRSDK
jgi:hypothetical protein